MIFNKILFPFPFSILFYFLVDIYQFINFIDHPLGIKLFTIFFNTFPLYFLMKSYISTRIFL